ncbi:MAG TPA: hypothetical protein VGW38_06970, partial [Chloroflexota bacterium]|nr:hypothetical protein [Chloroflexota bacterium]
MELAQATQVAQQAGGLALLGTALTLGLRHGIDWDHIAAIGDITSTTSGASGQTPPANRGARLTVNLQSVRLASLYAVGRASVVVVLGLAALYFNAILPDWVDPIMERLVGATLVL